jgi:hypothetical protein
MFMKRWFDKFVVWVKSFFKRGVHIQEALQPPSMEEIWVIVPGAYEKWVNPSNKNDKHYRAIYRSNKGGRRVGDEQFKRASEVLLFADDYNREIEHAIRRQGNQGA